MVKKFTQKNPLNHCLVKITLKKTMAVQIFNTLSDRGDKMQASYKTTTFRSIFHHILIVAISVILCITPVYSDEGADRGDKAGEVTPADRVEILPAKDANRAKNEETQPGKVKEQIKMPVKSDRLTPDSVISIDQAVDLAMKNNLQIKARYENILQSISQYDQAKSHLNIKSRLEGRVQAQGPARTLADLSPFPIPTDSGIDPTYTVMWDFDTSGRVVVEKILTSFGKIEHQKAAAFIKIEAEKQNVKALENDISFQVKQVFYNILKARESLKVAGEFADLANEYEDLAKKHFKAGVVSRYDILRAGVSVAESKKNIISANKALDLSKAQLLLLIDQRKDLSFDIESPPPVFLNENITLQDLQASALENRSEIKEIDTYIKVANKMLDAARSNNKPDLVVSGQFGGDVNPMGKGIVDNYAWNVGLSFKIPLFDGGETKAKTAEAESNVRELQVNREALGEQVKLQVKQAWLDYREARATIEVVHAELLQSKESYRLARARYKEGVSIAVEMDEALVGYNNSKKNLVNAMHNLNLAYASLERAVGNRLTGSNFIVLTPEKESVKLEAINSEK